MKPSVVFFPVYEMPGSGLEQLAGEGPRAGSQHLHRRTRHGLAHSPIPGSLLLQDYKRLSRRENTATLPRHAEAGAKAWIPLRPPSHPLPALLGVQGYAVPADPTDSYGKSRAKGSGAALALKIAFARFYYALGAADILWEFAWCTATHSPSTRRSLPSLPMPPFHEL